MAENLAETEAAAMALNNQQAPAGVVEDVANGPGDTGANGDDDDFVEESNEPMNYAAVARDSYLLDIFLFREDKANDFFVSNKEVAELVFKRLGVPKGMLLSADTTPYKKITLEIANGCQLGNLNITQSLQVRRGLWTRPLQAPEKDRVVRIMWAPMKLPGKDIESVLKLFGMVTHSVENIYIRDNGQDDWTADMDGVKTADRQCKMKISQNIPSLIMVRGIKLRVDYPGQPKTCSRCLMYWSACPGGGKVEKCKKEGGEEKDIKNVFKNLVNRLKKKARGADVETAGPVVPEFIPNPDMIKFSGFPESFSLADFKAWLDLNSVNFLEPMCFKEGKPGVFSISSVESDEGDFKLEAEEAAEIVTKLNGIQFENSSKRIMVTMMALTTPEKKKPEVVQLESTPEGGDDGDDDGDDDEEPQLAIGHDPSAPNDLVEVDTGEENMEGSEDDEERAADNLKKSLKLNLKATYTNGGTLHCTRVTGAKSKRADLSDTSVEASPELPKSQGDKTKGKKEGKGKEKEKSKPDKNQTKPARKRAK